ncbi:MAG: TfoX/Sxy family protein, partial [Paracoccaceae bacterium]
GQLLPSGFSLVASSSSVPSPGLPGILWAFEMALSAELREHIRDLFTDLGPIQIRRMFGGAGVYLDNACFALVIDDEIYMRGDETLAAEFEDAGAERWIYDNERRGPVTMPYWRLPDSAQDDPEEAAFWARKSLGPAQDAAAKKNRCQGTQSRTQSWLTRRRETALAALPVLTMVRPNNLGRTQWHDACLPPAIGR